MQPSLQPGVVVVARQLARPARTGDVVIFSHQGREKIKRVTGATDEKVYVQGDNRAVSSDSRSFGWIEQAAIRGMLIWPRI